MTIAFKAEALSLGDLLSGNRLYAVPVFQRAYSWTSREVSQLLGDLWLGLAEARQGDSPGHESLLLGSVVTVNNEHDAKGAAWVIDGKQRLTTLTVLLAALRDRLGDMAGWLNDLIWRFHPADMAATLVPRLSLDLEEDGYFGVQVRRLGGSAQMWEPEAGHKGRRGIHDCLEIILEDLADRPDTELLALAVFLRDHVCLVLISAPDIDAGFKTFVTTNHRGKPLAATDILKVELLAAVPEENRAQRLAQWISAERALGGDFQDLPGYLRDVHGVSHGATIRDVLELSQRAGGAAQFLDTLLFPLAERLQPIVKSNHIGSQYSERINASLRYLNWLRARDWVPPALAFCGRFPEYDAEFAGFLEGLERLAYGLQILGSGADKRLARYRTVIEALGSKVPTDGWVAPMALTAEEQWTMLLNVRGNLYHRSPSACKLLLKRLSASYPGDEYMHSLAEVTIEHLLPRNLSVQSPWRQAIPNSEEREACSKMLGNLVLITKQQNKDARNNGFDIKHRIIFPGRQASPHAITNQVISQLQWRAEDIRARDADLVQRMTQIWQLDEQPPPRRPKSAPAGA